MVHPKCPARSSRCMVYRLTMSLCWYRGVGICNLGRDSQYLLDDLDRFFGGGFEVD